MINELSNRRNIDLLILMFLSDLFILVLCWNASYFLRFRVVGDLLAVNNSLEYFLVSFLIIPIAAVALPLCNLYDSKHLIHTRFSLIPLIRSLILVLGGMAVFFFFYRELSYSRLTILLFFVSSLASMIGSRFFLKHFLRNLRKKGRMMKKVLVIGGGKNAEAFIQNVADSSHFGLNIVGYISKEPNPGLQKHLGGYGKIDETLKEKGIGQVYIALDTDQQSDLAIINKTLARHAADLFVVPDLHYSLNVRPEAFSMNELVVLSIRQSPLYGLNSYIKRALDVAMAVFFIALLSPLFLILPVLIKLGSRGPVIYSQRRMGLDGKIFEIYKFRSMKADAEKSTGAVWAKKNDDRTTPLGAFLRKTSLDEIPQFFNVLNGSMSIVGPRPERPELIEKFKEDIPYYMQRHKIKAGITGWAQIHGLRGNTSLKKRVEADLYYIANWSVWLDIKIVFITAFKVLWDKSAY